MPNHVRCALYLTGPEDDVSDCRQLMRTESMGEVRPLDFRQIIEEPPPFSDWPGDGIPRDLQDVADALVHGAAEVPSSFDTSSELDVRVRALQQSNRYRSLQSVLRDGLTPESARMLGRMLSGWGEAGVTSPLDFACEAWGTKWNAYGFEDRGDDAVWFQTAWSAPLPVVRKLSAMHPSLTVTLHWAEEDLGRNIGGVVFRAGVGAPVLLDGEDDAAGLAFWHCYPDGGDYAPPRPTRTFSDALAAAARAGR